MDQVYTTHLLHGVLFGAYTGQEIQKLSVKEITNKTTFDLLGHPVHGGLHDSALGPFERDDVCSTCGQTAMHCPGHIGHITLPVPVYSPLFFIPLVKLMRGTCFQCQRLTVAPPVGRLLLYRLKLLELGLVGAAEELQDVFYGQLADGEKERDMIEYYEQQVQELGFDKSKHCRDYKNITVLRENLVKDFLNGKFIHKTKCPHCNTSTRGQKLRTEYNAQVFLQVGKVDHRKAAVKKPPPKPKKKAVEADDEADVEPDIEMDDGKAGDDGNEEEAGQQTQLEEGLSSSSGQTYITASKARDHMRGVWQNDKELMRRILGVLHHSAVSQIGDQRNHHPVDMFFMDVVPVPPNRFRPVPMMGDKKFANPQTIQLQKVMEDCENIRTSLSALKDKDIEATLEEYPETKRLLDNLPGKTMALKLQLAWLQLQKHVNVLVDSDLDKLTSNKDKSPGIKQILEKKAGLLRMHMMGKRVDFAARSVISPDPYINTNEIGIPEVFAMKLTYPQPVTPWNFQELKQAVINGPLVHPGAVLVENENGSRMLLSSKNKTQREALAKQLLTPQPGAPVWGTKKVYRHLQNGDILLLNRQPTLHKNSIQAHKARILPGERTLRMHYANCKAYNADFDGDEMNAHFPQNEIARAEAYNIACTDYQYLVPKDGTPLPGLIQDHMVSGVSLTIRGRYFCRGDYHQLVFGSLSDRRGTVKTVPPSILKPHCLWSGKQVLSTVLLNVIPEDQPPLNIKGRSKVSEKTWGGGFPSSRWPVRPEQLEHMGESTVVIRGGELLVGILDKAHYGNTPYGLVHSCYELYGGPVAGRLLTALARLFTCFLQLRGFTLGVEDILVTKKADKKRRKLMKKGQKVGPEVTAAALGGEDPSDIKGLQRLIQTAHFSSDGGALKDLDLSMKGKTDEVQNNITKVSMPEGLQKKFPHNNLQLMVQSGAKGSTVNCMQISGLLGQIELEGRRPPLSMSGASLPCFLPYDMSPRAGGFVDGRFLTGIRPQEYFFHCMAGREGLVDTAVKTSRSGYLQRCIIKHLEGLTVNYDLTIRDSDGSVIQFQYGEDGMDISKSKFFEPRQLSFLIENQEVTGDQRSLREVERHTRSDKVNKYWKQVKKWKKKAKKRNRKRHSGFLSYSADSQTELPENIDHKTATKQLVDNWLNLDEDDKVSYEKQWPRCPDPVASRLLPCSHLGAITERMDALLNIYVQANPAGLLAADKADMKEEQMSEKRFRQLMHIRAQRALAEPGEAIGLLAAQSIGEPSTQMTLNTFHFAGRGEMNVTLGIPRLREILMVASATIKTPSMDIPLLDTPEAKVKVQKLKMKLNKVCLSQVLEDVHVYESVSVTDIKERCFVYRMRFNFLPPEMYQSEYNVTPSSILRYMELRFIKGLIVAINIKRTELTKAQLLTTGKVRSAEGAFGRARQDTQDDEDISDDDLNDGDAAATKARERQQEDLDYAGEEEEREEVDEESSSTEIESSASEGEPDKEKEGSSSSGEETMGTSTKKKKKKKKKKNADMDQTRINNVLHLPNVIKYEYDADEEQWCEVTIKLPLTTNKLDMTSLIESQAKQGRVYHTENISRCFVVEGRKAGEEGTRIRTEGVNIHEMYRYDDILDLTRLYSNDIHAMANTYGIEAAARVIIKEVRDVFAAYGINVDYRHLSLLSDYMTFEGEYKPFNRFGIQSNSSPLQKMTFETSMSFLRTATMIGTKDHLDSPSSRLVVGRLVKGGTGAFDLVQKPEVLTIES